MNFTITAKPLTKITADALVIFVLAEKITADEKLFDKLLTGQIAKLRAIGDLDGDLGQVKPIFGPPNLPRALIVGLGKPQELDLEKLRAAVSAVITNLKPLPVKSVCFAAPKIPAVKARLLAQELTSTIMLSAYEFSEYKKLDEKKKAVFEKIILAFPGEKNEADQGASAGQIIGRAVLFARDLGNHPSNVATPSHLAEHALRIGNAGKRIKVKILDREQIKKERMGGLLGVAKGSDEEPKFIILEYTTRKKYPTVVLVGKGITFDSGGISIKPSDKMEEMKNDMSGGADVMAVVRAASELSLPINLVGLVPATENLPSGKAIKPGDIVVSRAGTTIEVINTDAEGRLILADALDYAKLYKPALVIDFATLTGSIVVALGDDLIGAFTNKEGVLGKLRQAAKITGEKIWPMPLEESYKEFIKSDFADLRNIGILRNGDAINAANFLSSFVDYPWVHLDIAGTAWATREKPYRPKGATGVGVRLAIEFLRNFQKRS